MTSRFNKDGEYFKLYMKIYAFHKKHIAASTFEDWTACVKDLEQFEMPLEVDMAVAVVNELEREYKKHQAEVRE